MPSQLPINHKEIEEFCRRHHVRELALFGSVIRHDFQPKSDVDILVEFNPEADIDLMDLVMMRDELSVLLGREVDLVEKGAIKNPFRRKTILEAHEVLYAA